MFGLHSAFAEREQIKFFPAAHIVYTNMHIVCKWKSIFDKNPNKAEQEYDLPQGFLFKWNVSEIIAKGYGVFGTANIFGFKMHAHQ